MCSFHFICFTARSQLFIPILIQKCGWNGIRESFASKNWQHLKIPSHAEFTSPKMETHFKICFIIMVTIVYKTLKIRIWIHYTAFVFSEHDVKNAVHFSHHFLVTVSFPLYFDFRDFIRMTHNLRNKKCFAVTFCFKFFIKHSTCIFVTWKCKLFIIHEINKI